jgi:hypothetical protein
MGAQTHVRQPAFISERLDRCWADPLGVATSCQADASQHVVSPPTVATLTIWYLKASEEYCHICFLVFPQFECCSNMSSAQQPVGAEHPLNRGGANRPPSSTREGKQWRVTCTRPLCDSCLPAASLPGLLQQPSLQGVPTWRLDLRPAAAEQMTNLLPSTVPAAEATGLGNPKGPAHLAADAENAPDLARRSAADVLGPEALQRASVQAVRPPTGGADAPHLHAPGGEPG